MMSFEDWITARQKEQDFAYANGFNNGDPHTNGEYKCVDFLLRKHLDSFLDIGANKGIFSQHVLNNYPDLNLFAFEPNPLHRADFEALEEKHPSLKYYPLAISDKEGKLDFYRHPKHHETSSLNQRNLMTKSFQSQMEIISVDVGCLDNLDLPDDKLFLKVDTEGNEFPVIRGAKNLLTKANSAAILFEYSFGWLEANEDIRECYQFLNEAGFRFFRLLPHGFEEIRFITTDMTNHQYCNYIATKNISFDSDDQMDIPSPYGTNKLIKFSN